MQYRYIRQWGNSLLVRDSSGDRKIRKCSLSLFMRDDEGEHYKSHDGHPLVRYDFDTVKEANDFKKAYSGVGLYGAPSFADEYVHRNYRSAEPLLASDIRIAAFDIETGRDKKGYAKPHDPRTPVTAITLQELWSKKIIVWGTKDFDNTRADVDYRRFNSEEALLLDFINYIANRHLDAVTGWNIDGYDIPYIINRSKRIFGDQADEYVSRLSPFGFILEREVKIFNKKQIRYDVVGLSILDYLDIYKKFTYNQLESYKLDHVAYIELGTKKVDYSQYKHLQELYEKNHQRFIEYAIQDTELITKLDEKKQLLDLVLMLAYKAGVNYNDTLGTVKIWDVFIYHSLMDKGIPIPLDVGHNPRYNFVGGYVEEIMAASYGWSGSVDLDSLYPHLQMGYNISPDKLMEDDELNPELLAIREQLGSTVVGIEKLLNEEIDLSCLKKYNCSVTPNGQFYRNDGDGFLPSILEAVYAERKAVKTKMLSLEAEDVTNGTNHKKEISALNTRQMALKILINAEYGALGNEYFRWFDVRNAEAITSSGQLAVRWAAKTIDKYFVNTLTIDNAVIYSDTDSVYINLQKLVDRYMPDSAPEEIVEFLDNVFKDKIDPKVEEGYAELRAYVNSYKQKMRMKREVIAESSIWIGKKRYAMSVWDKEGVRYKTPKQKIVGLEAVRSSTPEMCRKAISETIKLILTEDELAVQAYIGKFKKEFYTAPPEEVAFPRGTNEIDKWIDERGGCKKSIPIHVRGCVVYNKAIGNNDPINELIQEGDKIKFIYMKMPNTLRSNVLSFPRYIPDELSDAKKYVNYDLQFEKTFLAPVTALLDIKHWHAEETVTLDSFFG